MMCRTWIGLLVILAATGCGDRRSSLLLERFARGPLSDALTVGHAIAWQLEPLVHVETQDGIRVTVNYASEQYLENFFDNEEIFGIFSGKNPYYPEQLVFYVEMANESDQRIRINPKQFVLVDDRGNQLASIGHDYITAFADYRAPVATGTRNVLQSARPGYFGLSLPVGSMVAKTSQWRFALLKQSALQPGFLYPGVAHDGLVAFWNPSSRAIQLTLLVTNVKMDFDANEEPKKSLEFAFTFGASHHVEDSEEDS